MPRWIAAVGLPLLVSLAHACAGDEPARASLSVAETLADTDTAGYARAVEPRAFRFPADHGPHPEFKHEWWYFTGNVEAVGRAGGEYGFQLTFFRNALRPDPATVESEWSTRQAYMGHFALTDVRNAEFHAFERFERGALGLAGSGGEPLRVWVGDWEAVLTRPEPGTGAGVRGATWRIRAEEEGVALDLVLRSADPTVLQGDRGLSQKGPEPGNASYYYSMKRLEARGTVTVGDSKLPVEGLAWRPTLHQPEKRPDPTSLDD